MFTFHQEVNFINNLNVIGPCVSIFLRKHQSATKLHLKCADGWKQYIFFIHQIIVLIFLGLDRYQASGHLITNNLNFGQLFLHRIHH